MNQNLQPASAATRGPVRSERNRDVPVARPGEFAPLRIGPLVVDPPVVLAPMAGVTNAPMAASARVARVGRCMVVPSGTNHIDRWKNTLHRANAEL